MKLLQFKISRFRNYEAMSYTAHPGLNLIVGHNGAGKTNFLDAIYYATLGRSYFTGLDRDVVSNGSDFMRLDYQFTLDETTKRVVFKLSRQKGKQLEIDKSPVNKMTEYIGTIRAVMMAPQDAFVMLVGNTERRKWLDQLLSQKDAEYAANLKNYHRILSRRNSYLKSTSPHKIDDQLLDTYWDQMKEPAIIIHRMRKQLLEGFDKKVSAYYARIADRAERVNIDYASILDDKTWEGLKSAFRKAEITMSSTQVGIHKDKIRFQIDGRNLKYYGSQGQTKSFFIALKLAEFDLLRSGEDTPILLVDDVFAKLDGDRIERLFGLFRELKGTQIFVTDTNEQRLSDLMDTLKMEGKVQRIEAGELRGELEEE